MASQNELRPCAVGCGAVLGIGDGQLLQRFGAVPAHLLASDQFDSHQMVVKSPTGQWCRTYVYGV
jgi:hypothetical protein